MSRLAMFQEPWLKGEAAVLLQGGFLLADRLCQTGSLTGVSKMEWGTVGRPIIDSIHEFHKQGDVKEEEQRYLNKKILCTIWSKLLEKEKAKDAEKSWKENALFPALARLPDINRTLLYEIIKSLDFHKIYVELLLCLKPVDLSSEVERLVEYVTTDTSPEDARLLLEVWRGLWRGDWGGTGTFDSIFTDQFTESPSRAAKRPKLDLEATPTSCSVMWHFFHAVREIKDSINSTDLCYCALSVCLDSIYTSFLLHHHVELSSLQKLERLSAEVAFMKQHIKTESLDFVKVICEAQKNIHAFETPSKVKPAGLTFTKAVQTVLCLVNIWEGKGLLKVTEECGQSKNAMLLITCIQRVLPHAEEYSTSETEEKESLDELKDALRKLSEGMPHNKQAQSSHEKASVAMGIIDNRLEGFHQFCPLFVAELSWALSGLEWIGCLERNKSAFTQRELVMKLVSNLIARCQTDEDLQICSRLKNLVVGLFRDLSMSDKNDTLVDIIKLSNKGLHGHLPQSLTTGFSEEVNLAFNCIIQGGTESTSDSAVSAIARVAFQNPETTLHQCCHLAVVNLGAHTHIVRILRHLRGLSDQPDSEEERQAGGSLLCRCLQDTVKDKLGTSQEQEQFLQFLVALMEPCSDTGRSFVSPREVFQTFIFPYLSSPAAHHSSMELSLRLLQAALVVEATGGSPHWVMDCAPFPLLFCLCQLLAESSRCWEEAAEMSIPVSMESKEILMSILSTLAGVVRKEVDAAPGAWSRALSWLHSKLETLDWTVGLHLTPLWGDHFKREVPSSLLAVCELPEQEWSGTELAQYGQGTGLLAWLECCCLSDGIQETMVNSLSLEGLSPDALSMFSKGLLLALSQTLPWCTGAEWTRITRAVKGLIASGHLHVPYSLEYTDFLPLLDLRAFAGELRLSVLLLRVFQFLCSPSCDNWLPLAGWAHVGRLYASTIRETLLEALKAKLHADGKVGSNNQEVLFVLTQLYCHVMHVHVMMPSQSEPLFLCALEILALYETIVMANPNSCTAMERDDTRHFLKTITDNLTNEHMKSVLQQKITQI